MNKTKIAISIIGIVALFAVLAAIPAASAIPTLHFVPQDTSVPEGYCNTKNVEIRLNLSADDTMVSYGQFGFSYDPLCGNIISRTLNTDMMTGVDPSWSTWNWYTMEDLCWNDTMDWVVFSFWLPKSGPSDELIGNFTIHCNSTEYCANDLNFGCMPGCPQGCIILWNYDDEEIPVDATNGTFECGEVPPPETFEKELVPGWNLISLPLTNATDMKVSNIIDTSLSGKYDALYKYDASTHSFVALSSLDTMENGVGYFIHMTAADTWTYTGSAYTSMSTGLSEGLNMVGWLNCSKTIGTGSGDALYSIKDNYYYVARWNAETQEFETYNPAAPSVFNDFTTMDRGEGYFISAKGVDTLSESC